MLRSLYTAGTAMIAQSRRMDVVTNNISNVETRGYKADTLVTRSFRDMLISRVNDPSITQYPVVGPHNTGIHIDQVFTSFTQGSLESTGLSTDIALTGDGFFAVETPGGERYTRSGNFVVDGNGYLVTVTGAYVRGSTGRIYVGTTDFTVGGDGTISVAGAPVDRLRIVSFADNQGLRKDRDSLFSNYDAVANPAVPSSSGVLQGHLENSNVDTGREMVNMMEIYRSYELNQRVLRMVDESLGRTVNDIARV